LIGDVSLEAKGPEEDELFAKDAFLWVNVRRGNTLIEIYDQHDFKKRISAFVARKGLSKFFDLNPPYVLPDTRYNETLLNPLQTNIKNYMLAPVKKALL
jgi:hypothetical protein